MNHKHRGFIPKYYCKVETKIKNGLLVQLMELHNVSALQLSKKVGISYTQLINLINLERSPCCKHPENSGSLFTKSAKKIAAFFHLEPTEIFPEEFWKPLEKNVLEFYLPSKKENLITNDERRIIYDALGSLTDRERQIVEQLFGLRDGRPMSMEEIGRSFNVDSSRVKTVKNRAMYKLQHSCHRQCLSQVLEGMNERLSMRRPAYRVGI